MSSGAITERAQIVSWNDQAVTITLRKRIGVSAEVFADIWNLTEYQAPCYSFLTVPTTSSDRYRADSVYNIWPPFTKVDITWHANPHERQPRESNRRQWKHHSQSKSKPVFSSSPVTRLKSSSLASVASPQWRLINISSWETNQRCRDNKSPCSSIPDGSLSIKGVVCSQFTGQSRWARLWHRQHFCVDIPVCRFILSFACKQTILCIPSRSLSVSTSPCSS